MEKVNIAEKFAGFSETWRPKTIGTVDDYDVKLVRIEGDFVWHSHPDEDEMFLCLEGRFTMEFRDRSVEVGPGEMIVVPRGVEHRPRADAQARIMLFERRGVVNTGDAPAGDLTAGVGERI
ncbi:MAG: cupin domain-containing protein [Alphaproteobacteria bacterium]|nr:cupin domain-containing protein [Alphaproteobacteria bacterium]